MDMNKMNESFTPVSYTHLDIHLGRGNANKILNRFLSRMAGRHDLYLCEINGGNLRNAIPREAYAICAVPEDAKHDVRTLSLIHISPNIVNYIDTAIIAKDIEESKAMKPDAIIACMHWGIEYQSLPDKEQKFLADWLIEKGVRCV